MRTIQCNTPITLQVLSETIFVYETPFHVQMMYDFVCKIAVMSVYLQHFYIFSV